MGNKKGVDLQHLEILSEYENFKTKSPFMHLLMVQKMYPFSADDCHVSVVQHSSLPVKSTQFFVYSKL